MRKREKMNEREGGREGKRYPIRTVDSAILHILTRLLGGHHFDRE